MGAGLTSTNYYDECAKAANQNKSPIFGLQDGNQCFYGGTIAQATRYGPVGNCNMKCSDGTNSMCGGADANTLFVITDSTKSPPAYVSLYKSYPIPSNY
jgi:hypothetical protein